MTSCQLFGCTSFTLFCLAALANIAGDGPNSRDTVIAAGVVQVVRLYAFPVSNETPELIRLHQPLLRLLDPTAGRQSMMRNCAWLMSNLVTKFVLKNVPCLIALCRGYP